MRAKILLGKFGKKYTVTLNAAYGKIDKIKHCGNEMDLQINSDNHDEKLVIGSLMGRSQGLL